VVETRVNDEHFRQVLGRCLAAHAGALQRAYAQEAERLAQRVAELLPINWEHILRLLENCRTAGFLPAGVERARILFGNPTPRQVRLFRMRGRLWRLANPRRALRVHKITLLVAPPSSQGFTNWEVVVDTDRHPNVDRGGKLCLGELRNRDLLSEETIPAIVAAVEVPNLDSAYWRPDDDDLEPVDSF
jgi:hypothetical protein